MQQGISIDGVPFKQVSTVLNGLGFVRKNMPKYITFTNTEHDAFIVLPRWRPAHLVGNSHLLSIANTLFYHGVASGQDFEKALSPAADAGNPADASGRLVA